MAGNMVSIMALTTTCKGGRQPETLPKFSRQQFSIMEKQNSRFRCTACHTVLPNNYKGYDECPFCHAKNSIITIAGREHKKRVSHEEMISNIKRKLIENPNFYTKKDMMQELNVSYPVVLLLCKALPLEILKLFRRKKKLLLPTKQETVTTGGEALEADNVSGTENSVSSREPLADVKQEPVNTAPIVSEKRVVFFDEKIEEAARTAFELKKDGYRVAEIASLLAVSPATVYWYLRKLKNS